MASSTFALALAAASAALRVSLCCAFCIAFSCVPLLRLFFLDWAFIASLILLASAIASLSSPFLFDDLVFSLFNCLLSGRALNSFAAVSFAF